MRYKYVVVYPSSVVVSVSTLTSQRRLVYVWCPYLSADHRLVRTDVEIVAARAVQDRTTPSKAKILSITQVKRRQLHKITNMLSISIPIPIISNLVAMIVVPSVHPDHVLSIVAILIATVPVVVDIHHLAHYPQKSSTL